MQKSQGHIDFIGQYEYFKVNDALYRAKRDRPLLNGRRSGEIVTYGAAIDFALRMARLAAGKPE